VSKGIQPELNIVESTEEYYTKFYGKFFYCLILIFALISISGCQKKKRVSKHSVLQMMQEKFERKASLKEQELHQRKLEFELEKAKFDLEANERKQRLNIEMEERRAFLNLMKDKL
jgi:cytochrome c biogenesis protein ResB